MNYKLQEWEQNQRIKVRRTNLCRSTYECPSCEVYGPRKADKENNMQIKEFKDIGIASPTLLEVMVSIHECRNRKCNTNEFPVSTEHVGDLETGYTNRVKMIVVDLITRQDYLIEDACAKMKKRYHVLVLPALASKWADRS